MAGVLGEEAAADGGYDSRLGRVLPLALGRVLGGRLDVAVDLNESAGTVS